MNLECADNPSIRLFYGLYRNAVLRTPQSRFFLI